MNDYSQEATAPFSNGYVMVRNARILTANVERALMDHKMWHQICYQINPNFLGKVGNRKYKFTPQRAVPANAVVVPESNHDSPETLLVEKRG